MTTQLLDIGDGFSCYSISERETRFIFKEIFQDHCYDIANLPDDPVIIDVGANIGLFTLYAKQKFPASTILSFEPAPRTFEVLSRNLALHKALGVQSYPCGLGVKETTATFTYYPTAPGNSTLFPEQKEGLKALVVERHPEVGPEMMEKWLGVGVEETISIQCLSHFIAGNVSVMKRIDLLKIDVEGAEFDVLAGLDDDHWDLIQNIVLELSEIGNAGALDKMERLLRGKGFVVTRGPSHPGWEKEIHVVKAHRERLAF